METGNGQKTIIIKVLSFKDSSVDGEKMEHLEQDIDCKKTSESKVELSDISKQAHVTKSDMLTERTDYVDRKNETKDGIDSDDNIKVEDNIDTENNSRVNCEGLRSGHFDHCECRDCNPSTTSSAYEEVSREWDVEEILNDRINKKNQIEYLIKWTDYPSRPTWELAANCKCEAKIRDFNMKKYIEYFE